MATALIGFEESQTVCMAFREMGIEAYSCDLLPPSGGRPEWHIQGDIYEALNARKWDFVGLHPPCTAMTLAGNKHYAPGKPKHAERLKAVEWTIQIWQEVTRKFSFAFMENPMGAMNGDTRLPVPQIIQPYYFGDEYTKIA